MRHEASNRLDYPAVGDWVILTNQVQYGPTLINEILPRLTAITRKVAGLKTDPQIIAANVTKVFIILGANEPLNKRKLERYLSAVWDSGASPVVVLSKADLSTDPKLHKEAAEQAALGVSILLWSATTKAGISDITTHISSGDTVVLIGSSGVGKSTLINALLQEEKQKTGSIREQDKRGRHTATHRELLFLPDGGVVIDTPGMRELQLWAEEDHDTSDGTFSDIGALTSTCRFNDCSHKSKPGCAIIQALKDGKIEQGRWDSYLKLQREFAHAARKQNAKLASEQKKQWKTQTKAHRKKKRQ
ncbi:ribosome small subunit-dependent GTPase A [Bacillus sp. JCM 19041]|uniref:ribosome small subunit-dependent GTPase A n=1 Tax=Bacillus sp. JCM 19041 TaxID=1460637 RepID=UPI0006D069DE